MMTTTPPQFAFEPWKVVDRREVLSLPPWIEVAIETVELPDGRRIDDYVQIYVTDFVIVFAETSDGHVVCLRHYRHAARGVSLELVAGHIDAGEDPLGAAKRELLEEAGYESSHWETLGRFVVSPTQGIGDGHVFRARGVVKRQEPFSGDLEDSTVELLDRKSLIAALRHGEVIAGSHVAALALALLK